MRPRVILADDHVMVAEALGRLIDEVADLVGRASDGQQLVESARRLKPDIIVSDITMPVMSGLDALRQLKSEQSSCALHIPDSPHRGERCRGSHARRGMRVSSQGGGGRRTARSHPRRHGRPHLSDTAYRRGCLADDVPARGSSRSTTLPPAKGKSCDWSRKASA